MRVALLVSTVGVLVAASPVASAAHGDARMMLPAFLIVRGEAGSPNITVTHGVLATAVVQGRRIPKLDSSPIHVLYSTLTPVSPAVDAGDLGEPVLEVAEFFGAKWMQVTDAAGQPQREVAFEEAGAHSKIYTSVDGKSLVWISPLVRPGGVGAKAFRISEEGIEVLLKHGLISRALASATLAHSQSR